MYVIVLNIRGDNFTWLCAVAGPVDARRESAGTVRGSSQGHLGLAQDRLWQQLCAPSHVVLPLHSGKAAHFFILGMVA